MIDPEIIQSKFGWNTKLIRYVPVVYTVYEFHVVEKLCSWRHQQAAVHLTYK